MNFFRAVGLSGKGEDHESDYEYEENLYIRDVLKNSHIFTSPSVSWPDRLQALEYIGHYAYTGGREASKVATRYLPHMLALFLSPSLTVEVRIQLMKTLCEIIHRNQLAVSIIQNNPKVMDTLVLQIADVKSLRLCRWSCYLLSLLIWQNIPLMKELHKREDLMLGLKFASKHPKRWEGWGSNLASELIRLFGWDEALKKPMASVLANVKKTLNEFKSQRDNSSVAVMSEADRHKITIDAAMKKLKRNQADLSEQGDDSVAEMSDAERHKMTIDAAMKKLKQNPADLLEEDDSSVAEMSDAERHKMTIDAAMEKLKCSPATLDEL